MNEITFNSLNELFVHLQSRGGADHTHGPIGTFYALMQKYMDPNVCSCKKGKNAYNGMIAVIRTMNATNGDALVKAKSLFDNRLVIVREGSSEVARF